MSTDIVALAHECGAVSYTPGVMRAVRGVSMTFEQLEDFAARLGAAARSPADAKPPGIDALLCIISSLRDTAHFRDEEGELTNQLRELRDWALAAHPTEPANHIERNLDMVEPVAAHEPQSTLHNAACDVPGLRNVPAVVTEEMHVAAVKVLHRASGVDGLPQRMLDAMLAAAPAQPAAGLVGLTHEEVVAAVTGPKSTGRWVEDVTRAFCRKHNLPLRDGGERG